MPPLLVLAILAAGPGQSSPPRAGPHEVVAGVGAVSYVSFFRAGPARPVLDLGYRRTLGASAVRVGGGLRATLPYPASIPGSPNIPLEGYLTAQLFARLGWWEPALGLEIGLSGLTDLGWTRGNLPPDLYQREQARLSAFYSGFTAAPLRARFGHWWVSALELHVGTTLDPAGAGGRLQVGLVSAGYNL